MAKNWGFPVMRTCNKPILNRKIVPKTLVNNLMLNAKLAGTSKASPLLMERFSKVKQRKIIDEEDKTHELANNPHPARGRRRPSGGGHPPQGYARPRGRTRSWRSSWPTRCSSPRPEGSPWKKTSGPGRRARVVALAADRRRLGQVWRGQLLRNAPMVAHSSDTILFWALPKLAGSLLLVQPRRHAHGLVPWKRSSGSVPPCLFLFFPDPADDVIFWVVLPDGALGLSFSSK